MQTQKKIALAAAGVAAGVAVRAFYRTGKSRSIRGESVLITGGSRGLGLALAKRFLREGCRVAICARDERELEKAREQLGDVFIARCDVTDRADVEQTIGRVTRQFGHIDILVNNAGEIQVGAIEDVTIEDFEKAMNTMFWGTVYPAMTVLPEFIRRNRGNIVNVTSIGGKVAVPHLVPYSSAKYAATGFSEGLRSELASTGVRVTTIAPGLMRTGSYNAAKFKGDREKEATWFSLGASLPPLAMDADRAAAQIVDAVRRGDAEKVLTAPASVLARVHSAAPGLTQDLLGMAAGLLLPKANGNKEAKPGWSLPNLRSPKMRALLFLGRLAAKQFNQRMA